MLAGAALLVGAYGVALAMAGSVAGDLFDVLGFGTTWGGVPPGAPTDYVLFTYGVLGAVIAGWMALVAVIAWGPVRRGERGACVAVLGAVAVWFVVDTGFSLAIGSVPHALFNVAFALLLGVPALLGWQAARTVG